MYAATIVSDRTAGQLIDRFGALRGRDIRLRNIQHVGCCANNAVNQDRGGNPAHVVF